MEIDVRAAGDVRIVSPAGDLTLGAASPGPESPGAAGRGALATTVERLVDEGHREILVDLGAVESIDSAGLVELVTASKACTQRGGRLKLLRPGPRVVDLLAVTRLSDVFEVFQDEAKALASF